jgi:putative ABC transport system permease protein
MLDRFWLELKISTRSLSRTPLFCLAAVLVLALGSGATTTIYSILQATLLKPLPYRAPGRIVSISMSNLANDVRDVGLSPGEYTDVKSSVPGLEDVAYSTDQAYTLTGLGEPQTLIGYRLSRNFLPLLGVAPLFGRNFGADEGATNGPQTALLSYGLWQKRFGGDRTVLGKTLTLDGAPYTVIGVMPREFQHPGPDTDIWTPMKLDAGAPNARNLRFLHVVGRLAPGATLQQVQAQLAGLSQRLRHAYPATNVGWSLEIKSIRDTYVGDIRVPLLILQGGAFFLLLIACANLVNFLLARGIARQRQFAIRMTLGAPASSVFLSIAVEAFLLLVCGTIAGFVLAKLCLDVIPRMMPTAVANLAIPSLENVPLNWASLIVSVLAGMTSGLLVTTFPVWRSLREGHVRESLGEASRGSSGRIARSPLRSALIIAEVALSLLLLVGSGLMLRTMLRLTERNLGFDPANVLTMYVVLPMNHYNNPQVVSHFLDQVLPAMKAIPGVTDAGAISMLPLSGMATHRTFKLEGYPSPSRDQQQANFRVVSPEYFKTIHMRLLKGRAFDARDRNRTVSTVVINESLAKLFPPGVDPVGSRIVVADLGTPEPKEVIGVVDDVRDEGFSTDPRPTIYRPFAQAFCPIVSFAIRTRSGPLHVSKAAVDTIWKSDRDLPVNHIATMERLISASVALRTLTLAILAVFAGTGLLLTLIGLYGLIAWDVTQRGHEIGIRLALGARKAQILWLVMRRAVALLLVGEMVGIIVSLFVTRGLSALLFDIRPTDFVTYAATALFVGAVALCASLAPSLHAVQIDPANILRIE